ncbi:hypothetical protein R3X27_14735 [Tropicimonas sp. TH_r6]|uniref:hypothetical protein n=1 Tax=Tropicimonas sp. TH_r6 TaxID=3082085 RepID=UPI002955A142|nr:hypothetical protein [Tropicimonas sp. TH_r6]MDV7143941.1 hypothetical protein [Tropicimonas sp. TH_r6]
MSESYPPIEIWRAAVVELLADALPPEQGQGRAGWNDMAVTAWQFGCMALAALGVAERRPWGAERSAQARGPDPAPRWDDICCVVLSVLGQTGALECLGPDGTLVHDPRWDIDRQALRKESGEPPEPTIAAAHGCGAAHGSAAAVRLLDRLGLVDGGQWSEAAEPIFWRRQPKGWGMAPKADPRFAEALEVCAWTLPEELADEIEQQVDVSEADVDAAMDRHLKAQAELIRDYPAQRRFQQKPSLEGMRRSEIFKRTRRLDNLFFEGWRLSDGWLTDTQLPAALTIFHDPLAMQMREALVRRLFPTSDLGRPPPG